MSTRTHLLTNIEPGLLLLDRSFLWFRPRVSALLLKRRSSSWQLSVIDADFQARPHLLRMRSVLILARSVVEVLRKLCPNIEKKVHHWHVNVPLGVDEKVIL